MATQFPSSTSKCLYQEACRATPLPYHTAAKNNCEFCIRTLNRACSRTNPNQVDSAGLSALHIAAKTSHTLAISALLDNMSTDRNPRDYLGLTPLHHAAITSSEDVVKLLLRDLRTHFKAKSRSGKTPLHFAAGSNNVVTTRALLNKYPNSSKLPRDHGGQTPIACAQLNTCADTLALLTRSSAKA